MRQQRILILDGFRSLALFAVLIYHLTNPFTARYPHHDFFLHIFKYGYLGVDFFFIISGFVINYTLENTDSLFAFYKNRFIRLFPAMLLCSLITLIVARSLSDSHELIHSQQAGNLLPGLIFINPSLLTYITHHEFHWINGSYWSLWVEVQFYFIASTVYFCNKANFFRNILIVSILITILKYLPHTILNNHLYPVNQQYMIAWLQNWQLGNEIFNITFNIMWFIWGVFFYQLYKNVRIKDQKFITICLVISFYYLIKDNHDFYPNFNIVLVALGLMIILFLILIYRKNLLSLLENRFITHIGKISYSAYLIHEVIGILLINAYSKYLGQWSFLAPFIVIAGTIGFADLSFRFYESKFIQLFKKREQLKHSVYKNDIHQCYR